MEKNRQRPQKEYDYPHKYISYVELALFKAFFDKHDHCMSIQKLDLYGFKNSISH
jgi:predicted nucleotidyltransferase